MPSTDMLIPMFSTDRGMRPCARLEQSGCVIELYQEGDVIMCRAKAHVPLRAVWVNDVVLPKGGSLRAQCRFLGIGFADKRQRVPTTCLLVPQRLYSGYSVSDLELTIHVLVDKDTCIHFVTGKTAN